MGKYISLVLIAALGVLSARANEWTNLSMENRLGGRVVTAGYLRGKVVVLDCRDYGDKANQAAARQLQQLWNAYKTKPFVVVGAHRGGGSLEAVKATVESFGVTYPVYNGAALEGLTPAGDGPQLLVFDATGSRRLYSGRDLKQVSGIAGSALMETRIPSNAKGWKLLLDYELERLPGQAFLRLKKFFADAKLQAEFKTKFPEDLARYRQAYEQGRASNEIKKLAKLVELSAMVKDRDPNERRQKPITKAVIEKNIEKFESLKSSANPDVVQEAKNAIADLKYAAATLAK